MNPAEQVQEIVRRNRTIIARTKTDYLRDVVHQLNSTRRLQLILGARGVGKSTAVRQFAKSTLDHSITAYLSLEDLVFDRMSLVEVATLLHDIGIRHLLLDEVHRYKNWSRELKLVYDGLPELKLIVTGSSVAALSRGDSDLSRRATRFLMPGLSWREYLSMLHKIDLPIVSLGDILKNSSEIESEVLSKVESPVRAFKQYLFRGYFPFSFEEEIDSFYLQAVRSSAMVAIDQDVVHTAGIQVESTHKLKRLLALLSEGVPFTPNLSTIAQQIGADRKTVYLLLELLERSLLITRLWSEGQSPKTLAKPEKIYLQNTNLSYALGNPDLGNLRETAFLMCTSVKHEVAAGNFGDFAIEDSHFEVGGSGKKRKQIADAPNGYRVVDDTEVGGGDRIPLYLFGLLY